MFERSLEQVQSSDDVRFDELARSVDGTIYMAFRGQMHHCVGLELADSSADGFSVCYVNMREAVSIAAYHIT